MAIKFTRLDVLKMERKKINDMLCLSFDIKEKAIEYYDHEIECIEKYGSANPEYTTGGTTEADIEECLRRR